MKELAEYFSKLRLDKNHHLGRGDIRLTLSQQYEIYKMVEKKLNKMRKNKKLLK
jgi:hypothetical protein